MSDRPFPVLGIPGYVPPRPAPLITTVLAVLVGDHGLPSRCVAVRYDVRLAQAADPLSDVEPVWRTDYTVLGHEELPADRSYPDIAARANTLARRLYDRNTRGDYHVLVDATDVGRPVVDSIRGGILPAVHVTSVRVKPDETADPSLLWRNEATVGLGYLVSRLRAILQARRLHVPPALSPLTEALAAHTTNQAEPSGDVRALALACSSEYRAVRYDQPPDDLGSPDF